MTGTEGRVTTFSVFNGLRTDTPASKCPADYSPDCSDIVFTVQGFGTRPPLRVFETLPAPIVYRKQFVGRDGATHILVLCSDGSLYAKSGTAFTLLDTVAAGSRCNSVTAYGREYMAFFIDGQGGTDAPRCWDGQNLYRVSQGGPGSAPAVTCITLPGTSLIAGTSGTTVPVSTVTPTDPQQFQTGGGGGGPDEYQPPVYQTYYTTLTVATKTPHSLNGGENVSISGNSQWNVSVAYVSQVIDALTFKIGYQQQSSASGSGGTLAISAPLLSRKNDVVRAATSSPHGLRVGFKAAIAGVADLSYAITSISTDPDLYPDEAQIVFPVQPGFVPGDSVAITNVPYVDAGGGVMGYNISNGIASVTTNNPHNLAVGLSVVVSLHTYAPRTVTVAAIVSATVWTYETSEPNVTDTGGYVHVPFPTEDGQTYTVSEIIDANTLRIPFSSPKFSWTGGDVTFPWDGSFYVDSVPSATTFTYRQSGPDATLESGSGTVTPQGQISPGEHQCCEHYITANGSITPPSPPFRFTAKVYQYPLVSLSKGPANVKARVLSFTAVNGGDFAMLLIPARAGGIQTSTSTVIQDNTTVGAIIDFPDTALLSATRIDIPGNDLFEVFPLTTPDGVEWYSDRLAWKGEKNVLLGMQNMAFDGGTSFADAAPKGWTQVDPSGVVIQSGFMPVYSIPAGQSGEIQQNCVRRYDGGQILEEGERYTFRLWVDGAHPGAVTAKLFSPTTGFATSASVAMTARGYMQATFDADTPNSIPDDMTLSIRSTSSDAIQIRDMQMPYTRNPNRWPNAVMSYTSQPDTYDLVTGIIGSLDDTSELRAMFKVQENFYFVMASGRLSYVQQIGNAEPSSWGVQGLADKCPAFNANSVVTGNAWAAWGGSQGAFWFTGGAPVRASAVIDPTWKRITGMNGMLNDVDGKRIFFATLSGNTPGLLMYDYRELELGGVGKWTLWNRPTVTVTTGSAVLFGIGAKTYSLDINPGIADDDFGDIGGYHVFAAAGSETLAQKTYGYLALRMSGSGMLTPFLFANTLASATTLNPCDLASNPDIVTEYPMNSRRGRLLFLKIGQPGLQFTFEQAALSWQIDPNSPYSGTRK